MKYKINYKTWEITIEGGTYPLKEFTSDILMILEKVIKSHRG